MRQHLLRQPAEFTAGIRVHDGPKTGNRRRLPRAHRNRRGRCCPAEAIRQAPEAMQPESDGQKSLQRRSTAKIRCRNHRKTVDSRKPGGGIEQAETAAKRLTAGNRHKAADHRKPDGQSRRKTIDSRNRSAETIDNRKSGRRELPETAAARPLRRISRDGPRRRTPLPT